MNVSTVIDIHNHPDWHGMTVDDLVRNMDKHGIARCWLLGWELPAVEFDAAPIYHEVMDPRGHCAELWMVMEGVKKYPDRFVPGFAPDPRHRHARARLLSAVKLHGVKVYGELKVRMRYDAPDALAMFRYCGTLKLPVLFHLQCAPGVLEELAGGIQAWPEWHGGDIGVVETMCRMCPETQFIGHGPGFWREMSADADADSRGYPDGEVVPGGKVPELMRRFDNLHCDLSARSGVNAFTRDIANGRDFLLEFQDRVLFGRDYFDRMQFEMLEEMHLPQEAAEKILFRNAEKIIAQAGESVVKKDF